MFEIEIAANVVELEFEMLDPTGGLFLPSNWVRKLTERIAIASMRTAKVNRFPA